MILVYLISKRHICQITRGRCSKETMDQDYDVKREANVVGVFCFVEVIHSHNGVDREEKIYHR